MPSYGETGSETRPVLKRTDHGTPYAPSGPQAPAGRVKRMSASRSANGRLYTARAWPHGVKGQALTAAAGEGPARSDVCPSPKVE